MAATRSKKILCQYVDVLGQTWHVTESRPTEHGWSILSGYPEINGGLAKGIKGPARVILTRELCSYLEEFRMKRGKVRLPLGSTAICKLRCKLGMNYWNDCKEWWKETESRDKTDPSSPRNDAPLKPKNLTWTRDEIRQVSELLDSGMSMSEIARKLRKNEKAVFKLRQRLFGLKVRFWTPEEEEMLREAVGGKLPLVFIAEKLNRSLSSIKGKIVRLSKTSLLGPPDKSRLLQDK